MAETWKNNGEDRPRRVSILEAEALGSSRPCWPRLIWVKGAERGRTMRKPATCECARKRDRREGGAGAELGGWAVAWQAVPPVIVHRGGPEPRAASEHLTWGSLDCGTEFWINLILISV